MKGWNKISLFKFQQIDEINNKKGMSDIDRALFSTCVVCGYTEFELDNLPVKKVEKLLNKIKKVIESPFKGIPYKRIGRYFINYDISKITFGQYIELSFFLSGGLSHAHYIIATLSNLPFLKNNAKYHRKKADYFLKKSIVKISGAVELIIKNYSAFNKEYSTLFGLDPSVNGDAQSNFFNKRYGWIYSASQIAEYERVSLEEVFKLPIRQALNDLAYLKAKSKYEFEQSKIKK